MYHTMCQFAFFLNSIQWACLALPTSSTVYPICFTSWLFFLPRHYDKVLQDTGYFKTNELMALSLVEHRRVACN
jgi:hypothetical protein